MPSQAATLPQELIVADGATDVRSQERPDGAVELLYRANQPYPAVGLLASIHAAVPRERWQPLTDDWLNPGNPSSHKTGWGSFIDGTKSPNTLVHRWNGQWKDRDGNIVVYALDYNSAYNAALPLFSQLPGNSRLEVSAMWVPTSTAKAIQDALSIAAPEQIR
jgi:hypothetical protein